MTASARARAAPALAGQLVVVVEDDATTVAILAALAQQLGARRVEAFQDGLALVEALPMLARATPSAGALLLLDLQMPGLDGLLLLRAIADGPFRPDIVPMSLSDSRLLETALRLGVQHGLAMRQVLPKPVSRARLLAALEAPRLSAAFAAPAPPAPAQPAAEELSAAFAASGFVPWYQPKRTLADGTIRGVEVLARWQREAGAVLPPLRFMGGIESSGLATALLLAILRQAIADVSRFAPHLGIAVNVSMQSLQALDLPDRLAALAHAGGIAPARIVLEVTESEVVGDLAAVLETTTRLRLLGFGLAIDDFGTGHSSLLQLRRLPFTELKIDRSFVHDAAGDAATRAILEVTVELARRLQLATVAEGVESEAECAFVAALGVDAAQGYAVGRPMPAEGLARLAVPG